MLAILAGTAVFQPNRMKARPDSATTVSSPAAPAALPAEKMHKIHLAESYGKLPLSFEANQGQTDSRVKFLSHGAGYALFLTGDEAVLTLKKSSVAGRQLPVSARVASAGTRPDLVGRSAPGGVAQHPLFGAAGLPNLLPFPSAGMEDPSGQKLEKPRDRRAGPALPFSSRHMAASGESSAVLRMRLVGANAWATVTGADELPGKSNYFIGNDPKKWRTNVPTYAKVKYAGVYPGVDLVYYGNQGGQLEYDFVVAPGADPNAIRLDVGAGLVPAREGRPRGVPPQISSDGDLVVKIDDGEVRFHKPVVYQEQSTVDSSQLTAQDELRNSKFQNRQSTIVNRQFLDGRYVLLADNQVGFKVDSYDHARPLVIDPTLAYSTYLGGNHDDYGQAIAVDSSANAYVTGGTASTNFPLANPFQATNKAASGGNEVVFVAKFNTFGLHLVYSTYLGGSVLDAGYAIAVDSSGNAYVTGSSYSPDFPTVNPFQATNRDLFAGNAFVTKLDAAGSALVYSTYLGGEITGVEQGDRGMGIAVDSSGQAYVTGFTGSSGFPTTPNAFQPTRAASSGFTAFVTKFNAAGSGLVWSTYLGGSIYDEANSIAVDSLDDVYVTGETESLDFPVVIAIQPNRGGCADQEVIYCFDAFVTKFFPDGSSLLYSTYLGGSGDDMGQGIAVDSNLNAYVTGTTNSTDFPTRNPFQSTCNGCVPGYAAYVNAFVAKLSAVGTSLVYSTYLGGSVSDFGNGIAVDSSGRAYVTGNTGSLDFPITGNAYQATNHGMYDAFLTEFNAAGSALVYSTYLGGSATDGGNGIALDPWDNAYVTGTTNSTDFPTLSPFQPSNRGGNDAFVARFLTGGPAVVLHPINGAPWQFLPQILGGSSLPENENMTNPGGATLVISSIVATGDFSQTNNCRDSLPPGTTCTISVTFTPTALGPATGTLTITDNAPGSPQTLTLSGLGVLPIVLNPSALTFGNQAENTTSPAQTVTLTNTQSTPVAIVITTSPDFGQTNTCGGSVPARSSCTITVTFTPSIVGLEAGTLSVLNAATGGLLQSITLSGRGVVPTINLPPS
jgi:hypothetical protein